ncbi:hypothetical protein CHLNCDRAFT_33707 [Chlorella variabilis]|uniref:Glutamyl-tRNA reductase n=1 Tax=Chlorella variabilis TaxID=554065 RepID=E1Z3K3_CHLVA|nr:hypothetical protein CHLNCDRAFT_33707 [Chlorella variabilis]EFN59864.1 hypothetical protein CHLNCDRAFT_33707 [Chlorella variabilis]|eukprot:XP_005851966.1 hypothetical protein CHLNCDRAFT_33707 [Chlorella variabilis]
MQVAAATQQVASLRRLQTFGRTTRRRQPCGVQCAASTAAEATVSVKLPATHIASSQAALQQLQSTKAVNRYAMEKKSSIIAIGLTIHNAPVELREKLAVPEAEWPRAIEELCSYPHIEEAAVLSTCNRMEIYVVGLSFHRGVREVEEWMSRASGVPLDQLRPHLFLLRDRDATGHLLRVSGGLDSLVMGEGQILAQVKQVHKVGQNCPGFGRHLNGLFKQAVTAGKRVRAETSISSGAVSVSSAAAELAQLKLPSHDFNDAKVCIIGAGKMSRLLVKHMHSKGCTRMTVLNRSLPRAEALAEEFPEVQFDIHLMHDLMKCVEEHDLIFAASGSEELLVRREDVAGMAPASDKVRCPPPPRFPPAVPPPCHAPLPGPATQPASAPAAGGVSCACMPVCVCVCLRPRCVGCSNRCLEGCGGACGLFRSAGWQQCHQRYPPRYGEAALAAQVIEELSKGIVNKLLHGPMTALRCDGADPMAVAETLATMEALERMFGLTGEDDLSPAQAQKVAAKAGQR